MKDSKLHVDRCPLCEIFTKGNLPTKLYFPEEEKIQKVNDFVIVDCISCKVPMVVVTDHTTDIGKEQWGRILYRVRKMFGNGTRLRLVRRTVKDHWHAHITHTTINPKKIPDLRMKKVNVYNVV